MVVVAVAGGTGHVGRAIVDAILADAKHQVIILSRKANPELEKEIGAPIFAVDYIDIEGTTKLLEEKNVHTIISGITMLGTPDNPAREIELFRAADASTTTRRVVASDWGLDHKPEHSSFPTVPPKLASRAWLRTENKTLEWTAVHTGFFLDYWCIGAVPSYLPPSATVVDTDNNFASIPGSGNTPVAFTHTRDVGKLTSALLDLEKWEESTFAVANRKTWLEFLRLAEEAKGVKFEVKYDSIEDLQQGKVNELPGWAGMSDYIPKEFMISVTAQFGQWFEDGSFNMPPEGTKSLTEIFPDIKTLSVEEALRLKWKKN